MLKIKSISTLLFICFFVCPFFVIGQTDSSAQIIPAANVVIDSSKIVNSAVSDTSKTSTPVTTAVPLTDSLKNQAISNSASDTSKKEAAIPMPSLSVDSTKKDSANTIVSNPDTTKKELEQVPEVRPSRPIIIQPEEIITGAPLKAPPEPPPSLNLDVIDTTELRPIPKYIKLKPSLGLGVGVLSFYGDISNKSFEAPSLGRSSYELSITQEVFSSLSAKFYFMSGKLVSTGVNDKKQFNIQSQLYLGGVQLFYTFNNLLPYGHSVEPYITMGLEGFEFLTKSDLKDKYGNTYHYWEDGSIRNISETSAESYKAVKVKRDYVYESDLRQADTDKRGKYGEFAFAIPVGFGFRFLINDKTKFNIGTTFHFTTTDLIDNISTSGIGVREGKSGRDNFMMISASLNYDLTKKKDLEQLEKDQYVYDLYENGDEDYDADGVIDFLDSAAGTPAGVPVNRKGIPFDNDKDKIPNYRDKEVYTPKDSVVDGWGVTLTDSARLAQYDAYMNPDGKVKIEVLKTIDAPTDGGGYFKVMLGQYKTGVPSDQINKFLSLREIGSFNQEDSSVVFTTGAFDTYAAAKARLETVKGLGLNDAKIVVHKDYKFIPVDDSNYKSYEKTLTDRHKEDHAAFASRDSSAKNNANSEGTSQTNGPENSNETIYHVQLGAYKTKISNKVFFGIKDVLAISGDDGLTRYVTGSFTKFEDAAKLKVILTTKGFPGAFIASYKGGKRISLQTSGVKFLEPNNEDTVTVASSVMNKNEIEFRVQIGIYKGDIPQKTKAIFSSMKVDKIEGSNGSVRYTTGSFRDFKEAQAAKQKVIAKGITDAFIIALFKDEIISVPEALEMLKN